MNRVFLLLLGLFFFIADTIGQKFDFSPELRNAYEQIILLELKEGEKLIDQVKNNDPNNHLVYHIENYIDFFKCFINEEEKEFDKLHINKDKRISQIKKGDNSSPYYRFSQAEVLLQWALVELKFKKYIPALLGMNEAIKLLEDNNKLYPNFIANKKSLSALHALVGTIPDKYKNMLGWITSFNGTIAQGYSEIDEVYTEMNSDKFPFSQEVIVIKALIELHFVNDKTKAYKTVQHPLLKPTLNPLLSFIVANVTHKSGKNDEAIEILESYSPTSTQHPLYYLDYLKGIYKLNRLDEDSDLYIRRYLNYFQGNNYIKEAYQKLAWHAWAIKGDSLEYERNMKFCISKGDDLIDEDKQALDLAKKSSLPNRNLLKARLLNDGSYERRALKLLQSIESEERSKKEEIEYLYRRGRIAQGLELYIEAESYYLKCVEKSFDRKQYFQTAACLYLAQVYEKQFNNEKARYYYSYCLKLDPDQYKASLHQKAKAGLLRIKKDLK